MLLSPFVYTTLTKSLGISTKTAIWMQHLRKAISNNANKNYQSTALSSIDAIDEFTKNLVYEKRRKWSKVGDEEIGCINATFLIKNELIKKINCLSLLNENKLYVDFNTLTNTQISYLIEQALEVKRQDEVDELLEKCLSSQKVISSHILDKLFHNYSCSGNVKKVMQLQSYTERLCQEYHKVNGCFEHFLAKCHFINGNINRCLELLRECYVKNHVYSRSKIVVVLSEIISLTVRNGSEASLVLCCEEVEYYSKIYKDNRALQALWKSTWFSQRHSDQCYANELVDKHPCLVDYISDRGVFLAMGVLKLHNNEDAVIRLVQLLLKYNLMQPYAKVLQVLFNYRLRNGDTKGCHEIMKNCRVLNIELPINQSQYVCMLISNNPTKMKSFQLKF